MAGPGPTRGPRERGQILPIFCIMLTLLLLPVAGLAVDGGVLLSSHANLVGAVQAAAEAGSQAVDVTSLERDGTFQLCATPDGGADCGNGIGDVGQVVSAELAGAYSGAPVRCSEAGSSIPSQVPAGGSGCTFEMLASCPSTTVPPTPVPEGVEVVGWQTVQLPLLIFPGWSSVVLRATATSWLEHGFGTGSLPLAGTGSPC